MKRLFRIMVLAVIMAVIPACAGMTAKKITISFWAINENCWRDAAKLFMKENPGVEVKVLDGDLDKLYTLIAAGNMPDVWGPWGTPGIKADVNRGWAIPLDPYVKRDSKEMNLNDFFPGMMRQFRVAGRLYSLPITCSVDYYYYNTQMYAQAGLVPPTTDGNDKTWNWAMMLANAQKLTKYGDQGKIRIAGIDPFLNSQDPNYYLMWNAPLYGEDALASSVPQQIHWSDPKMVNCLTKVWELISKYKVANPVQGGFETQKTAAALGQGPFINTPMRTKGLNWAIAPLPWGETNSGTLWTNGWRIGTRCKNKEMAWEFVKFLCRPDIMRNIVADPKSQRYGTPAARISIFSETLGRDIGKATKMSPADVLKVHSAMDESGILKRQESICLHMDLLPFWNPIKQRIWDNKVSPQQGAKQLQDITDRQLPILFKRWVKNIKFTGKEKK